MYEKEFSKEDTLCEEIIFEEDSFKAKETAICNSPECCLLQISINDFLDLDINRNKGGGDGV